MCIFFVLDVLWCGYCKVFVFEYVKVVMKFKEEGLVIKFVKVDVIKEIKFGEKY